MNQELLLLTSLADGLYNFAAELQRTGDSVQPQASPSDIIIELSSYLESVMANFEDLCMVENLQRINFTREQAELSRLRGMILWYKWCLNCTSNESTSISFDSSAQDRNAILALLDKPGLKKNYKAISPEEVQGLGVTPVKNKWMEFSNRVVFCLDYVIRILDVFLYKGTCFDISPVWLFAILIEFAYRAKLVVLSMAEGRIVDDPRAVPQSVRPCSEYAIENDDLKHLQKCGFLPGFDWKLVNDPRYSGDPFKAFICFNTTKEFADVSLSLADHYSHQESVMRQKAICEIIGRFGPMLTCVPCPNAGQDLRILLDSLSSVISHGPQLPRSVFEEIKSRTIISLDYEPSLHLLIGSLEDVSSALKLVVAKAENPNNIGRNDGSVSKQVLLNLLASLESHSGFEYGKAMFYTSELMKNLRVRSGARTVHLQIQSAVRTFSLRE